MILLMASGGGCLPESRLCRHFKSLDPTLSQSGGFEQKESRKRENPYYYPDSY
jgi:hypothetical protein